MYNEDSKKDKELAFPHIELDTYSGKPCNQHYGLTKRELFAAMFMQSLLSNPERYKYISEKVASGMSHEEASSKNAHKAVLLADALLTELNKEDSHE